MAPPPEPSGTHAQTNGKQFKTLLIDQGFNVVTIANIVVIGVSADVAIGWAGWTFIDFVFAVFFLVEMILKLKLLGTRVYFYGPTCRWNIMEAILVGLAIGEIMMTVYADYMADGRGDKGKTSLLRILRLLRIARVLRVCRLDWFSELAQMISGAMGGMRTLMWSIVLISLPLFAVALLLRETLGNSLDPDGSSENFSSLAQSFFTVFRCVTGDCSQEDGKPIFVLVTSAHGWGFGVLYFLIMVSCTFGLFNVIAAIYVENTVAASKYNELTRKRDRIQNERMLAELTKSLVEAVLRVGEKQGLMNDADQSQNAPSESTGSDIQDEIEALVTKAAQVQITKEWWSFLELDPGFAELLSELDIAGEDQSDLFDTFDIDESGSVDLAELLSGIKKLRGDARRSDVVGISLQATAVYHKIAELQVTTEEALDAQTSLLQSVEDTLSLVRAKLDI